MRAVGSAFACGCGTRCSEASSACGSERRVLPARQGAVRHVELEWNVVVGADRGAGRPVLGLVVGCELWSSEELDGVGDDLDGLALGPVWGLPFAPVQASVDGDAPAVGEVARGVLALRSEDGDVEVVGLGSPFTAR